MGSIVPLHRFLLLLLLAGWLLVKGHVAWAQVEPPPLGAGSSTMMVTTDLPAPPPAQRVQRQASALSADCTSEGLMIIYVSATSTRPNLDPSSVLIPNQGAPECLPVLLGADLARFSFPLDQCGTRVELRGDVLVYSNEVLATRTRVSGPRGIVTRDSEYWLWVECHMNGTANLVVEVLVNTLSPPTPQIALGLFAFLLEVFPDGLYSVPYLSVDFPLVKTLGDPLYFQVSLRGPTDQNLVLHLDDCWATSSADPQDPVKWQLVVNECPVQSSCCSVWFPGVVNVSPASFFKRFAVDTFAFMVAPGQVGTRDSVYFHCSVVVCDSRNPSAFPECSRQCSSGRHARSMDLTEVEMLPRQQVTFLGPFIFVDLFDDGTREIPSSLGRRDVPVVTEAGQVAVQEDAQQRRQLCPNGLLALCAAMLCACLAFTAFWALGNTFPAMKGEKIPD
ncbi:zona pellucida sperm-binding protein 4-like isoform X1 [Petromyzon marinus]|uniref:zona pellucida sperm-binding protein 4-like isoform X1 n=1 Tax=Petromyzon marinus TaxID=7757 RepID=UPI003F6EC949